MMSVREVAGWLDLQGVEEGTLNQAATARRTLEDGKEYL